MNRYSLSWQDIIFLTLSENWLLGLIHTEPQNKVHPYMLLQFFTDS